MRNKLSAAIVILIIIICFFPYSLTARKISHQHFIHFMAKQANIVNTDIQQKRQKLLQLYTQFKAKKTLTHADQLWLKTLSNQYKLKNANFAKNQTWIALLKRVDIIPVSLAIAQAINESAWGNSRFAREGNNYFGQWCYVKGCGLIPKRREAGATFEVKKFDSPLASVKSYMLNLNSAHLYQSFRDKRWQLRQAHQPLTGLELVSALTMYSTKRQRYVKIITKIINDFGLSQYDRQKTKH